VPDVLVPLHAAGPGLLLLLAAWAIWYVIDPPVRPEGVSWVRMILWVVSPLGLYLYLARHKEEPSTMNSAVGREGRVVQVEPLEVEVFGSFWQARLLGGAELRQGDRVRVVSRDGLTMVVERIS